jgi:hypothetical protein
MAKGDLAAMDDIAFFRHTVRSAWDTTDAAPTSTTQLPRIVGELVEGKRVYALVQHNEFVAEDDKRLDYSRSEVMTFTQEGEAWKIVAFPFAPLVAKAWSDELFKAAKPAAP